LDLTAEARRCGRSAVSRIWADLDGWDQAATASLEEEAFFLACGRTSSSRGIGGKGPVLAGCGCGSDRCEAWRRRSCRRSRDSMGGAEWEEEVEESEGAEEISPRRGREMSVRIWERVRLGFERR
jgi:hypothetical protein